MEAIYDVRGTIANTRPYAGGPWNPEHQHGAAPSSLIAWAADRLPTAIPMHVVRVTVDLLRPVPIAPLEIKAEVVREGRKIQVCAVRLLANGTEVARGSVLKIRVEDLALPDMARETPVEVPYADALPETEKLGGPDHNSFGTGISVRVAHGAFRTPGPAAIWFRANRPIIEGDAITPLMRAVITSDFCNGTAAVFDFRQWTFINGDLSVHLARPPVGEWILLDAQMYAGERGAAVAFARLGDKRGYFGRATQSIVLERR